MVTVGKVVWRGRAFLGVQGLLRSLPGAGAGGQRLGRGGGVCRVDGGVAALSSPAW